MGQSFAACASAEAVRTARRYVAQNLIVDPRVVAGVLAERDALDAENLRLREQAGEMATELDAARSTIAEKDREIDRLRGRFGAAAAFGDVLTPDAVRSILDAPPTRKDDQ